jgi:hypothetical protein
MLRVSVIRVHGQAICWNEGRVIDYFLRHYEITAPCCYETEQEGDDQLPRHGPISIIPSRKRL